MCTTSDRDHLFTGCQPVEEIAASGEKSLAFGPLRPVGLHDPAHRAAPLRRGAAAPGKRRGHVVGAGGLPDAAGRFGEQRRVFRQIPGLANAEFVRYGQMHRNFYLDSPRCLRSDFPLAERDDVFVAGQITGVEGYVESIASGLHTAWRVVARLRGLSLPPLPAMSLSGALLDGYLFDGTGERFSPMNVNFGLLPDLDPPVRGKRERKLAKGRRAVAAMADWLADHPLPVSL